MLTQEFIVQHTNAKIINHNLYHPTTEVSLVDFDSRRLTKDSCYIALTIGSTDGHHYIEHALNSGANLVVVSNEQFITQEFLNRATFLQVEDTLLAFQTLAKAYRLALNIPVIGITGSNGKTTSKDMIASLLGSKLSVHKTFKNFNNHLGVPLTLLQAKPAHDVIVLEMGMNHAGELDILGSISKPNIVVITNIGESHIEFLGSRENIAHAKGELLLHLQKGGTAFLPYDCEFRDLLSEKTKEKILYFNIDDGNNHDNSQIVAHSLQVSEKGTSFWFHNAWNFCIPLYGEHNVLNTLPAISIAFQFGFNEKEIFDGLKDLCISPMRFERTQCRNNTLLINDAYNASPTSMKKSCETFLTIFSSKRCVLVLGDMFELGENAESFHQEVGDFLNNHCEKIEFLVTIGEVSQRISGRFHGRKRHFKTKEEASKFLQCFLSEDFVFLLKASRGMKLETLIEKWQ